MDQLDLSIYDTAALVQVVPNLKLASTFLLDTFFPTTSDSDQETVAIDVDVGLRRLAPLVTPLVEGKLVESRTIQTNMFKPAYVKDKRPLDPRKPVRRMIGERIGGDLKPGQREQLNLMLEMADQVDMINRRKVWMGSQVLQTGKLTMVIEGQSSIATPTVIDFQRSDDLTPVLAGSNTWDHILPWSTATISPSADLDDWAALVLQKSGAVVTDIVFTKSSWRWFKLDPAVKDALHFPRSGDSNLNLGGGVQNGAIFKGMWGNYRCWLYNDWYIDDQDGTEKPMIPDGVVIMGGPAMQGLQANGLIIDPDFNYQPMAYAPKSWVEKDPARRLLMMQAAPITIPSRVNACLCATVCSPD